MQFDPPKSARQRTSHLLGALAVVMAVAAAAPVASQAATVSLEGNVLVLRAAPGEDLLRVEEEGGKVQLAGAPVSAYPSPACAPAQWSANAVDCTIQPGGVRVEAGDGDDTVTVYGGLPATQAVTVEGGAGADELSAFSHGGTARLDGGDGNDELNGSSQNDTLLGGPGDDKLDGEEGADELRGGDGADNLRGDTNGAPHADVIDGGSGRDVIDGDWAASSPSQQPYIDVSLDGQANDGRAGEGDNVTSVEYVHLNYAATLAASSDPVDFEVFNSANGGSRLVGSPGADRLRSYDDRDSIEAGAGDDWIETGYGDDTIDPGPGRDTVNAEAGSGSCNFLVCRVGSGNDTVNARDGEVDSIDCGVGTDVANVDANDVVTGCETVNVPQSNGGGPTPPADGPSTGGGATARGCTVPRVKAGTKQATVVTRVKKAGCKAKVVKTTSKKVRRGRVIKLSPKAGRQLERGASVRVYVSKGKPRKR